MADTIRSTDAFLNSSTGLFRSTGAGSITAQHLRDFTLSSYRPEAIMPGGRLTTETGVGVSTSDRLAQATLRYTPYAHDLIGLYDGTSWTLHDFTERSLSLTGLTSGANYDVFLWNNAGTLTLELSAAWSSDTARTDGLTTQDGVVVKSGAATRRWLGTIRTTGTTTTEDSETRRFVWNAYRQVPRRLHRYQGIGTEHAYNTLTFREWNGGTGGPHRVYWVAGDPAVVDVAGWVEIKGGGAGPISIASFALNSSTEEGFAAANIAASVFLRVGICSPYSARLGFNELVVTEYGNTTGTSFNYYRLGAVVWG